VGFPHAVAPAREHRPVHRHHAGPADDHSPRVPRVRVVVVVVVGVVDPRVIPIGVRVHVHVHAWAGAEPSG
jgi:hypothetical protein